MPRWIRICFLAVVALLPSTGWAQNWVELTPIAGPMPAPRGYASAVLDTKDGRMIVFGGRDGSGDYNDIWAFDLTSNTWTDLTPSTGPAPAARRTPGSIYDPTGHRMITWSGQAPGVFFNDVWAFDLSTHTWSESSTPAGGPPNVRYGVAVTFDPVAGDLVTFAGFTNLGRFDDVWRFNGSANTWTDASPVSGPLKRCLHSASYDSHNHRMIMYGGQNAGALDDIWALDLTSDTWTDLTPSTKPAGRFFAAHVYDAFNHRATIFGGNKSPGVTDEVWVFDLWSNQWAQLLPSGTAPPAREGAAGIYEQCNDRMVVFGGSGGGFQNDVWAVENLSTTVTGIPSLPANGIALHQNYPNPFNPTTVIRYDISSSAHVALRIYDSNGRVVRTLVDESRAEGPNCAVWDGRDSGGATVASGVYFYRMETAVGSLTRKLVFVK